jgi:micrococcal nuclease
MLWRLLSACLAIALAVLWFKGDQAPRRVLPIAQQTALPPSTKQAARYPVEVISIVDGDSFHARVSLWPGQELKTLVRVRGIDAPEKKARCRQERAIAEKSRQLLAELASEGFVITDPRPDKYGGRVLATVLLPDGSSVADHMLATGAARAYQGKARKSWCV